MSLNGVLMRKGKRCIPGPGDWVLLKDDEVIACDKDVEKIMETADKFEPGQVVIAKIPVSEYCFY